MPAPSNIQTIKHAGHDCLQLSTRHGSLILALHGAHLISWVPTGQRDVFWLSDASLPEPAAIRGGVPLCWPWFGKQGIPQGAPQHGPVRNRHWTVSAVLADSAERVSITLAPSRATTATDPLLQFAPHLQVTLHVDLGETLVQTLETRNHGSEAFVLTQALHSYFAVQDASRVQIQGLAGLAFHDKVTGTTDNLQPGAFLLDTACDRIYQHDAQDLEHHYTVEDGAWQRRIHIRTQGSQSMVVWNPGAEQARSMVDVPDAAWRDFLCVETANAGKDSVTLEPGTRHRLTQTLAVEHWHT